MHFVGHQTNRSIVQGIRQRVAKLMRKGNKVRLVADVGLDTAASSASLDDQTRNHGVATRNQGQGLILKP
jgi:hypothetical protein